MKRRDFLQKLCSALAAVPLLTVMGKAEIIEAKAYYTGNVALNPPMMYFCAKYINPEFLAKPKSDGYHAYDDINKKHVRWNFAQQEWEECEKPAHADAWSVKRGFPRRHDSQSRRIQLI
jgi:hypothetical protein